MDVELVARHLLLALFALLGAGCTAHASDLSSDNPIICSMAFASESVAVEASNPALAEEMSARSLLIPGLMEASRYPKARETEILAEFMQQPDTRARLITECSVFLDQLPNLDRRVAAVKEEMRLRSNLGSRAIAATDLTCAVAFGAAAAIAENEERAKPSKDEANARLAYELEGTPRGEAAWEARMQSAAQTLAPKRQRLDETIAQCMRQQNADTLFNRELPTRIRVARLMQSRL